MNARGVFFSPMPITYISDSRRRLARRVKSLSEETMQKASRFFWYSRSMASMMSAESDEFLPVVLLYCWMGWMALSRSWVFHEFRSEVVQFP